MKLDRAAEGVRRAGLAGFLLLAAILTRGAPAGEADVPAPLPPPPELLNILGIDGVPYLPAAPGDAAETRRALEPPAAVAAPAGGENPPPRPPPSRPAAVSRAPMSDLTVSPPSQFMPSEYFDFPIDAGGEEVPGVVMPEVDESYFANQVPRGPPLGRAAVPGMSVRQLSPFLALAKGSEAAAIEAGKTGDQAVFAEQIAKALSAYADIVAMADAGNEAREEAWYGVARCEYRRGNWWKAFDALERSFPGRFDRSEVAGRIKLEMFIGERLWRLGGAKVADAHSGDGLLNGYQAASRVYAAAIFNQPTASDAPLALLRRGDAAAIEEDWEAAEKFYRQVVEYYPESDPAMQARSSLAEAVLRRYSAGAPEAARDDVGLIMDDVERADAELSSEAEERRRRAVALANDIEAETRLRHAKEYLKNVRVRKSRDAAVFLLGDIVSHFPAAPQAREAADILRNMGIDPPMVLSDGGRFPIASGWSGRESGAGGVFPGGSATLDGQDGGGGGVSPPPSETVYQEAAPVQAGAP
ncbi:MAG: hypothetical protein LBU23_06945 [Planctomycetota bacterium]|jgi:tetratricopeptide (TPR) repeat protein|nr:hypothetical protein [Planctomycetota bacterium]